MGDADVVVGEALGLAESVGVVVAVGDGGTVSPALSQAAKDYVAEVTGGTFPGPEHTYTS